MAEPRTYPSDPAELPFKETELEPAPVDGCAGCRELANVRDRARAGNDQTTVTDCNVLMARHPDGHG
ncbi:hypothetical protein ABT112_09975 [Streptomyces sp. NPDC002055]|uniref:hypothetical protein n=1 Tax=Streptomyces sp. NPDC002055 TaxID=3154534 RepID=UPI00332B11A0